MNYIYANINYIKTDIEGYDFTFKNKGMVNFSLEAQTHLPWGITNNMSYFFLPKGNWEIYRIEKPIQQFDISFNKEFLDKKLKVGLHCFDVFNANEVNALVEGKNLRTLFYEKMTQDIPNFIDLQLWKLEITDRKHQHSGRESQRRQ
ncbi:outer membrane beta-barrel protein [Flavobacterium lindanitolerans]|nr:outer membrane beta-barrel protein [Flavobacterium lindanitolerans]